MTFYSPPDVGLRSFTLNDLAIQLVLASNLKVTSQSLEMKGTENFSQRDPQWSRRCSCGRLKKLWPAASANHSNLTSAQHSQLRQSASRRGSWVFFLIT